MFRRILKFSASLKLAVILLLSLAAVLGCATYFEARYDAKTASHLVYGSRWFSLFLFMLGVNVASAAAVRYPWRRHQTGFVITHVGIIIILIGSFITRIGGLEGNMALAEGETSRNVLLDQPQLTYQLITPHSKAGPVQQTDAEFRWSPPTPQHPRRFTLAPGLVAVVDQYLHNAMPLTRYENSGQEVNPAVQFRLQSSRADVQEWLALADAERRQVQMGPARVRLVAAKDAAELAALLSPPPPDASAGQDGWLVFTADGRQHTVAVAANLGQTVAVKGTPYRIRLDRYLPYAVVVNNKLTNRSDQRVNPAVEFAVLDSSGEAEQHIEFARFPEFSTTHHQVRPVRLKVTYTFDDPSAPQHGVDLIVGPAEQLHYRIFGGAANQVARTGVAEVGKGVPTGWMDMVLTVTDYCPRAVVKHEFVAMRPARGKEGPPPAIHLTLEGADPPGPYWLQQGDDTALKIPGNQILRIGYQLQNFDVGFDVKLKKFEVGYDPGTHNAATYTSHVHVDDKARSASFDQTITMNEPMKCGGLTFFQASFQENEGQAPISVLQVAKDPGVPIKYVGAILLVVGSAIMFFFKPYSKKNRVARAQKESV